MSLMDDAKKVAEDARKAVDNIGDDAKDKMNDAENKYHETKGEMKGRIDQSEEDDEDMETVEEGEKYPHP